MQTGGHLTQEGLHDILSIKASINKGLTEKLRTAFPDIRPFELPAVEQTTNIYDPHWLVGFVCGEGSFSSSPYREKTFRARFYITQHSRDLDLVKTIQVYFGGIGSYSKNGTGFNYEVGLSDNFKHIIPFFDKYPFPSVSLKSYNFKVWKEIVYIIHSKGHYTPEGRLEIAYLLSKLNKWGEVKSGYVFMYNRDKTILYYYSMEKDYINILNIHYHTFQKHLEMGTYYLGRYVFTREPALTAEVRLMSLSDLGLKLEKDRAKKKG